MLPIHKNIRARRIELGMSQEQLAKETGYTSRTSVAKIEAGEIDLPQSKIIQFAVALRTTPVRLMGWDYAEEPGDVLRNIAQDIQSAEIIAAAQLGISREAVEVARAYDDSAAAIKTAVEKLLDIEERGQLSKFLEEKTNKKGG